VKAINAIIAFGCNPGQIVHIHVPQLPSCISLVPV